jgi:hypothetical protein
MNRNETGNKNPQNRTDLESQSQSRQASGRDSSDVSQRQDASRSASQQDVGRNESMTQKSSRGSDSKSNC